MATDIHPDRRRQTLPKVAVVLVTAVLASTAAGCQSAQSVATMSAAAPALSSISTPATVSAPAMTPTDSEDELTAEAKDVYSKIRAELDKLESQGGADELPAALDEYVTGNLREYLIGSYKAWKGNGYVAVGAPIETVWIRRYPDNHGSTVALFACLDATKTQTQIGSGSIMPGKIIHNYLYLKHFDGQLKAFEGEFKEGSTCNI